MGLVGKRGQRQRRGKEAKTEKVEGAKTEEVKGARVIRIEIGDKVRQDGL